MALLIAEEGHNVKGIYLGSCNQVFFQKAIESYKIKSKTLRALKVFESSGDSDDLVSDKSRQRIKIAIEEAGIKQHKTKVYQGGHRPNKDDFVEGIKWITSNDE